MSEDNHHLMALRLIWTEFGQSCTGCIFHKTPRTWNKPISSPSLQLGSNRWNSNTDGGIWSCDTHTWWWSISPKEALRRRLHLALLACLLLRQENVYAVAIKWGYSVNVMPLFWVSRSVITAKHQAGLLRLSVCHCHKCQCTWEIEAKSLPYRTSLLPSTLSVLPSLVFLCSVDAVTWGRGSFLTFFFLILIFSSFKVL